MTFVTLGGGDKSGVCYTKKKLGWLEAGVTLVTLFFFKTLLNIITHINIYGSLGRILAPNLPLTESKAAKIG